MKYRIHRGVPTQQILKVVPSAYKQVIPLADFHEAAYTLLIFDLARASVTSSRIVRKALEKLEQQEDAGSFPMLAIAANLTDEAQTLLEECGARIYTLSPFFWTDESYHRIRQP